jgi:hypothetical protein
VSKGLLHLFLQAANATPCGRQWPESDRCGTFQPILTVSHNQTPAHTNYTPNLRRMEVADRFDAVRDWFSEIP